MAAIKYWLWLTQLQGLKLQSRYALLDHYGDPEEVYFADLDQIEARQIIPSGQLSCLENHSLERANEILAQCDRLGIHILTIQDATYPARLRNIYDPPCVLYVKGRLPMVDEQLCVAGVGTRSATPYGEACAEKLGFGLASGGAVVVSGLAKGIDTAIIRGALRADGITIGVLGNGIDVVYPRENRKLYEDVAAKGALVSEYPPKTQPKPMHFPVRNRILSGLCQAALVVEAPEKSGALITAKTALEQGRDVFAVPGPIDVESSRGCNHLIRDGAGLVSDGWDILREYTPQYPQLKPVQSLEEPVVLGYEERQMEAVKPTGELLPMKQAKEKLTDDQITILQTMGDSPVVVDEVTERSGLPTRRVLSALTLLELDGYIRLDAGNFYCRLVSVVE
ncbi:DNA-processing protein DprA [Bengtsoniella intestinalis]|uniref:DNA-processing protein DprA n=1 Tax=Bengtsoniella intestinalis TaxID=3073143 RepID=UPI00391F673A